MPGRPGGGKEAILVVLPYGMCFRNVVMNKALWGYLIESFDVDLLADLDVRNPHGLGVRRIFTLAQEGRLARLARAVNYAAVGCLRLLDATRFFVRGDLGGMWVSNLRVLETPGKRARLLFLSAIRELERCWPFSWLVRTVEWFPRCYPTLSILKANRYKFVILGHTNENLCILVARYANRLGAPVICSVMGVDNVLHGLLQFVPDLLLLWGPEQAREFRDFQVPLKAELARTRCEIVGGLTYDNYVQVAREEAGSREAFAREYGIGEGEETVLFVTHLAKYLPGQIELSTVIVDFLLREGIRAKFVARLRPGIDQTEWRALAAKYPGVVKLQIPYGAAYDKSNLQPSFDPVEASRDIELFVRTVRSSALLILPSLSTMYLDGLLFGVPSVVTMFNPTLPENPGAHRDVKSYFDLTVLDRTFRNLAIVWSREELLEYLRRFFVLRERRLPPEAVFESQAAASNDGRSGERARRAIERFLGGRGGEGLPRAVARSAYGTD